MGLTDDQVKAQRDDIRMMERPSLWPHLLLPLKRPRERNGMEVGVLYPAQDNDGKYLVVSGVTIFGPLASDPVTLVYGDAEAVYDAGWRVD